MGGTIDSTYDVGTVIDARYRVIDVLGEGGMSVVYLCEHTLIRRYVAVKVMHAGLAEDHGSLERFLNEARAAGTLGHPNIIESTDMGFIEDGRRPYIVFEHLEGSLLTDEIYRHKGLDVTRAVQIAHQIASALGAAHEAGIVHRDVKSDNVFLVEQDAADPDLVKVLDFGISKFQRADRHTQRGVTMGTPEFMAPEQIQAPEAVDPRADVYALGVILYEMIEARRPFPANEDPRTLLHKIVHNEPPPFRRDVPLRLQELVMMMLAKSPNDRPQSMEDVHAQLAAFAPAIRRPARSLQRLTPRPFNTPSTPPATRTPSPHLSRITRDEGRSPISQHVAKRGPWLAVALAAALAVVSALIVIVVLQRDSSSTPVATTPAPTAASVASIVMQPRAEKLELLIDSTIPGARVTFRRRVAAAPLRQEISASDIIELVEVSAPGHRTTRYWLTLDRPTKLLAQLATGDGTVEATELETLVALGEAAPTRTPAKPTAIAKVDAPKRKIGPGAAQPKIAKTVARPPEPSPVAAKADVKPTLKLEAGTTSTIVTPEVLPAKPESAPQPQPQPAKPVVTDAPKPRAVPATAIEASRLSGQRTIVPDDTTKVAIAGSKEPKVITAAKLCLSVSGRIDGVTVLKSSGYPSYDQRIVREMQAWRFKPVMVDGKATPICTSITFIYNQK